MDESTIFSIIFIAIGAFSIMASLFDWDFFFNNRKAQLFLRLFGRTGARIIYTIIGLGIFLVGFLSMIGLIDLSNQAQ